MRLPLSLATLALLAGCSTVSTVREAWNWDATAPRERMRIVLTPEQLASLSNRLAELRIQRNDIRSRISAEADIGVRLRLYEDLHRVGMQLSPLERRLAGAAS